MKEVQISRIDISAQKIERKKDFVAEERPLHIFLNQTHYVTILCSPSQLKELAVGHLLSEGVLKSIDDIREIRLEKDGKCRVRLRPGVDAEKRISVSQPFARLIVSACGSPDYWPLAKLIDRLDLSKVALGLTVEARVVLESVRRLNRLAKTFRKTGGVHIAALYSANGELKILAEDVGRHNAVDKVVGTGLLKRLNFEDCFLTSSGRLTGDIVLKSARMRIPIVASMTAATDSGVEAAQRTGLTLVGFARGKRMNVFTHPERIVFKAD
ncbi:formate dehydrogenase accessory sulfurtransferase FdhD [Candidatus Bathyarchaeota archaeon]|nr:formate dehydrogenase accessory sulfurtransferase FdhD [Candidatus Bathyarchaeota archaeon]